MPFLGEINDGARRQIINRLYLEIVVPWIDGLLPYMKASQAVTLIPIWAAIVDNHFQGKISTAMGLARRLRYSRSTVTRHLVDLKQLGIIAWEDDTKKTRCRLSDGYRKKAKGSIRLWDQVENQIHDASKQLHERPRNNNNNGNKPRKRQPNAVKK